MNAIYTRLVHIGNSRGIRIPKTLLAQLRLTDRVQLEVVADTLVVRAAETPDLDAGYRAMAADVAYEAEARAWIEGLVSDVAR